eukprot:scpid83927/ scgid5193/ 
MLRTPRQASQLTVLTLTQARSYKLDMPAAVEEAEGDLQDVAVEDEVAESLLSLRTQVQFLDVDVVQQLLHLVQPGTESPGSAHIPGRHTPAQPTRGAGFIQDRYEAIRAASAHWHFALRERWSSGVSAVERQAMCQSVVNSTQGPSPSPGDSKQESERSICAGQHPPATLHC